jgi:hypothetical protein
MIFIAKTNLMKKQIQKAKCLTLLLVLMCFCASIADAQLSITPRKYRKGFHIELFSFFKKKTSSEAHTATPKHQKKKEEQTSNAETHTTSTDNVTASIETTAPALIDPVSQAIENAEKQAAADEPMVVPEVKAEKVRPSKESENIKGDEKKHVLIKKYSDKFKNAKTIVERGVETKGKTIEWHTIVSFLCALIGLVAFGIIFGLLAVIFGVIGIRKTERNKNKSGKGFAFAGIILGAFEAALIAIIISHDTRYR